MFVRKSLVADFFHCSVDSKEMPERCDIFLARSHSMHGSGIGA